MISKKGDMPYWIIIMLIALVFLLIMILVSVEAGGGVTSILQDLGLIL